MPASEGLRRCSVLPELIDEGIVATVEDIWTKSNENEVQMGSQILSDEERRGDEDKKGVCGVSAQNVRREVMMKGLSRGGRGSTGEAADRPETQLWCVWSKQGSRCFNDSGYRAEE